MPRIEKDVEFASENQASRFAKNKSQLAIALGVSRTTIDAWFLLPDSPRARSNGQHEIAEWKVFASTRKVETDANEAVKLKLKKLKQEVELNDIKILQQCGDLVPLDWCNQLVAHLTITMRNVIQGSDDLSPNSKAALTAKLEGIKYDHFLSQLRKQIADTMAGESGEDGSAVAEDSTNPEA